MLRRDAAALRDELRSIFEDLRELEKTDPHAVDELVGVMGATCSRGTWLRSRLLRFTATGRAT